MEAKFQALLPPLKRFRLLQHQQQQQEQQEQEQEQEQEHVARHHHRLEEEYKENLPIISLQQLPAKKRRSQSRSTSSLTLLHPTPTPTPTTFTTTSTTTTTTTTSYCLPTKKRIRAFQPDYFSVSGKPLLPLDLNVEYKPSFNEVEDLECIDKNKKTPFAIGANQCEIAQTCEKINPIENPFGDNPHQSISTEKQEEEEEEKQNPFTGAHVQSTQITEQAEAETEDDGILCAICQSTDGDPSDPIVFCDGCDLMVHSTCYGNPLAKGIPEGDWFCSRCLISPLQEQKMPISCCLCPSKNGALKPTKNGSWAHIVCALFVPEVFFEDPDGREGIDCSRVPNRRWGGKCYLCRSRKGCVVECSESKCPLAFHVTCALDGDLCIEYQEGKNKRETIVAGFCKSHTELWRKQQKTGKFKIVAREECKK